MGRVIALLICLLSANAYAQDQPRLPDLSMSPEETYHDFNSQTGSAPTVPATPDYNAGATNSNNGYIPSYTALSTGFMGQYCNPNIRPLVENDCMQEQRQRVCNEFMHLPADAQAVINNTISCMESDSNNDSACAGGDSQRLQLVQKYQQNADVLHALTFMPEDMVKDSIACANERY